MNNFVNFGMGAAFEFWGSEKSCVCNLYAFRENSHLPKRLFNGRFGRLLCIKDLAPARACPHAGIAAKRAPGVKAGSEGATPKGLP